MSTLYPGHGGGDVDGVDMDALRAKYSRPREQLQAEAAQLDAQRSMTSTHGAKQGAQMGAAYDRLQDIIMCQNCQAMGTLKKQYGFRVIDEVCDQCDGEGVIRKGQAKFASAELRAKVKQVEALVESCEDLVELERLEAALKKRTIPALDAVLGVAPATGAESTEPPAPVDQTEAPAEDEENAAPEDEDEEAPPPLQK